MPYIGVSPSNGVRRVFDYTATAGQTSFSGSDNNSQTLTYTDSAYIDVYQNGILLIPSDYTATTGTTVVLDTGATVSDTLQIVVYDVFSVADTVSASDGGSFGGNLGVGGTLAVTGVPTFTGRSVHSGGITVANDGQIGSVGDADAITISSEGYVTQSGLPFIFVNGNDANTRTLSNSHVFFNTAEASQAAASVTGSSTVTGAGNNGIAYTSGNGRFTVPVAGKYLITGRFRYAETGDEAVSVAINTNANQDVAYCILQCTEATTLIITACANLAANDYIRFVHNSGADRGFYMANSHCGASIFLIG